MTEAEERENDLRKNTEEAESIKVENEKKAIDYLVSNFRLKARQVEKQCKQGPHYSLYVKELDMLSCICEFLMRFDTYRFDKRFWRFRDDKTPRQIEDPDEKYEDIKAENRRINPRWSIEMNDQAISNIENMLKPVMKNHYKTIKTKLDGEIKNYLQSEDANEEKDVEKMISEVKAFYEVSRQVIFLIRNYRVFSPMIKNESIGLGESLYKKLTMHRAVLANCVSSYTPEEPDQDLLNFLNREFDGDDEWLKHRKPNMDARDVFMER